jgi:hypothetical protein
MLVCFASKHTVSLKVVWPSKTYQYATFHGPTLTGEFCIHLRSLNFRHFVTVETTALKIWRRDHLKWHDRLAEFHKNLRTGSKVIRGHIGGRTGRMVI